MAKAKKSKKDQVIKKRVFYPSMLDRLSILNRLHHLIFLKNQILREAEELQLK